MATDLKIVVEPGEGESVSLGGVGVDFFAALGELTASSPPEELAERRAELARGYDHYFVHPEWVPELKSKYGLKMLGED